MMSIRAKMTIALICLAVVLSAGPLAAAPKAGGPVFGWANLLPRNTALSRHMAITGALRRAVVAQVRTLISTQMFAARLEAMSRAIFSRPKGFVKSHSVEAEARGGGGYMVLVNVDVDRSAVKRALARLGLLVSAKDVPAALFFVVQRVGEGQPVYWWAKDPNRRRVPPAQAALEAEMRRLGARVINPITVKLTRAYQRLALTDRQVIRLAKRAGAGLVIMGRVLIKHVPGEGGKPDTTSITLNLKALRVVDRAVLATRSHVELATGKPGQRPALAPALKRAAALALPHLVKNVMAGLTAAAGPIITAKLVLIGVKDYEDLAQFQTVLRRNIPVVKSVTQKAVTGGKVIFAVTVAGTLDDLSSRLLAQDYRTFFISVKKVSDTELQVTIIPKP